jgi:hypothetical protein
LKKYKNDQKINVFGKKSNKVSINAEYHADFKSVEKIVKKCTQKSYQKNKFEEHE